MKRAAEQRLPFWSIHRGAIIHGEKCELGYNKESKAIEQ